jgi:hypothetical protein
MEEGPMVEGSGAGIPEEANSSPPPLRARKSKRNSTTAKDPSDKPSKKAKKEKDQVDVGGVEGPGEESPCKSFARRARPSSNPASIAKWDAIRDVFNNQIRALAVPKVSTHEACVSKQNHHLGFVHFFVLFGSQILVTQNILFIMLAYIRQAALKFFEKNVGLAPYTFKL